MSLEPVNFEEPTQAPGLNPTVEDAATQAVTTIPALTAPISGAFAGGNGVLLTLKAGDFGEWIKVQITDANGPVDISQATLKLTLRGLYDPISLIAAGAAVTSTQNGGVQNEIGYLLVDGDTDKAGDYALEVQMTWTNGRARTSNALRLSILSDLG